MKTIIHRLEADEFKQILDGEKSYIVFKGEAQSGQRILLQTETEELDCTVGLVATSPGVFKGHSILTLQRPAERVPPKLEFDFGKAKPSDYTGPQAAGIDWTVVGLSEEQLALKGVSSWAPPASDDAIRPAGDPSPAPAFPKDRQEPPM